VIVTREEDRNQRSEETENKLGTQEKQRSEKTRAELRLDIDFYSRHL
jgi:hypothetical protein